MNVYEKLEYLENKGWKYEEVANTRYGHRHRMLCPSDKPLWGTEDGVSWCASSDLTYVITHAYNEHKRRIEDV